MRALMLFGVPTLLWTVIIATIVNVL